MCKIANLFITIFANYFDNVQRREALAKIPLPETSETKRTNRQIRQPRVVVFPAFPVTFRNKEKSPLECGGKEPKSTLHNGRLENLRSDGRNS